MKPNLLAMHFSLFAFSLVIWLSSSSAIFQDALSEGSHLSVETPGHVLISRNGIFSAGFYPVGRNAYSFAIWFKDPSCPSNCTVVWMANRDLPVNGRYSKLSLTKSGNLVLTDAKDSIVWFTDFPPSSSSLHLLDCGNLVLVTTEGVILWQSFQSPTNTLLPGQQLTRNKQLVSSRSQSNFSSGFYKLSFDDSSVLRLLFDGPDLSSRYWPEPWLLSREAGRTTFNSSRTAMLDSYGNFTSTDNFYAQAADYGEFFQRRLTLDVDGNLRLYSRENWRGSWVVSWQAITHPCRIHGSCGPYGVCSYAPSFGRTCSCLPGFKMKNLTDWSLGCEPEFRASCEKSEATFHHLTRVEMYGYDSGYLENYTLDMCKEECLKSCDCKGFVFKYVFQNRPDYVPYCFPKTKLTNGFRSPTFRGDLYVRVTKTRRFSNNWPAVKEKSLDCPAGVVEKLKREYAKSEENWSLHFLLWFSVSIGVIEIFSIILVSLFLNRTRPNREATAQGYLLAGTRFQKFSYSELKKATHNFREEIGRGASGIVYKGRLDDNRVAAIKQLYGAKEEGKRRLLVYEYMEHGPLDANLSSKALDWRKRFEIAIGIASGLAYLHEECLEWILHCDVKPQNILLDSNYNPKVSDFGLSRLLSRGDLHDASFSKIRGTRGYMAPEWLRNLPITSKVDVYSYGIVVLELVTGKNPAKEANAVDGCLLEWIRKKTNSGEVMASWIKDIIDPNMGSEPKVDKLELLVEVALKCVEQDRDSRPTMCQVIEMLVCREKS